MLMHHCCWQDQAHVLVSMRASVLNLNYFTGWPFLPCILVCYKIQILTSSHD